MPSRGYEVKAAANNVILAMQSIAACLTLLLEVNCYCKKSPAWMCSIHSCWQQSLFAAPEIDVSLGCRRPDCHETKIVTLQSALSQELLVPLMTDNDVKIDIAIFAAMNLGLVLTIICNGNAIEA